MDFRNLNISQLKYYKNNLYYDNERVIISIPISTCYSDGVQKYFNKYEITLKFNINNLEHKKFYHFIKSLEEYNKLHVNHLSTYKTIINQLNEEEFLLIIKVPFKYDKYEVNVEGDEDRYLSTLYDLKKDDKLKCKIQLTKLWTFSSKGKLMSGCIVELKSIYLFSK